MGAVGAVYGRSIDGNDLLMLFSLRLDETGTDGRFPFTVVSGAVATIDQWNKLETAWRRMLATYKVVAFHTKEFDQRSGDFAGWSNLKREQFTARREKICDRNTTFRVTVGINRSVHAEVKKRMRGISGFKPDSDYGLCLRWLMHHTSTNLDRLFGPDYGGLSILLEDGPYSAGAVAMYKDVRRMTGGRRPAQFAHKLAGIASLPKGNLSLEAADSIAGIESKRFLQPRETRLRAVTHTRLSVLLDEPELEAWYRLMIEEKQKRRDYAAAKKASYAAGERN